jgi:hypothetical protein
MQFLPHGNHIGTHIFSSAHLVNIAGTGRARLDGCPDAPACVRDGALFVMHPAALGLDRRGPRCTGFVVGRPAATVAVIGPWLGRCRRAGCSPQARLSSVDPARWRGVWDGWHSASGAIPTDQSASCAVRRLWRVCVVAVCARRTFASVGRIAVLRVYWRYSNRHDQVRAQMTGGALLDGRPRCFTEVPRACRERG